MKIENEMKFRVDDTSKLEDKILGSGFVFEKEINQEDLYFSPPHKKFAGTKKYYLRLRKQDGDKCSFAYHEVINDLQTKELEAEINGCNNFFEILKKIDFVLDCIVKKERKVFKNNLFEIVVDNVTDLGSFIELEYIGEREKNINSLFDELISNLELDKKNLVAGLGYPDLLMEKMNQNHD